LRLKIDLAASVERPRAPDLKFWNWTVDIEVAHRQHAGPELAAALRGDFDKAVDDLRQKLDDELQAETLLAGESQAAGDTPASDAPTAEESAEGQE
jgi:hypothetical protein